MTSVPSDSPDPRQSDAWRLADTPTPSWPAEFWQFLREHKKWWLLPILLVLLLMGLLVFLTTSPAAPPDPGNLRNDLDGGEDRRSGGGGRPAIGWRRRRGGHGCEGRIDGSRMNGGRRTHGVTRRLRGRVVPTHALRICGLFGAASCARNRRALLLVQTQD